VDFFSPIPDTAPKPFPPYLLAPETAGFHAMYLQAFSQVARAPPPISNGSRPTVFSVCFTSWAFLKTLTPNFKSYHSPPGWVLRYFSKELKQLGVCKPLPKDPSDTYRRRHPTTTFSRLSWFASRRHEPQTNFSPPPPSIRKNQSRLLPTSVFQENPPKPILLAALREKRFSFTPPFWNVGPVISPAPIQCLLHGFSVHPDTPISLSLPGREAPPKTILLATNTVDNHKPRGPFYGILPFLTSGALLFRRFLFFSRVIFFPGVPPPGCPLPCRHCPPLLLSPLCFILGPGPQGETPRPPQPQKTTTPTPNRTWIFFSTKLLT